MHKVLRYGDKGQCVRVLQSILRAQGYFDGYIGGNFLTKTRAAVLYFQQTHKGEDGGWLDVDGIVGPDTWWALYHPTGADQADGIEGGIVPGLDPVRVKVLKVALKERAEGTKEIPDGANWGDGVTKFVKHVGPQPWCNYFVSWVAHEATGKWPLGKNHGHVLTFWREAKKKGIALHKEDYAPVPGDAFVMLYRSSSTGRLTGSGHIGFVLSVAPDGKSFNTVEGNAGNRVKIGIRKVSQTSLEGFVKLWPQHGDFTRKLFPAGEMPGGQDTTR